MDEVTARSNWFYGMDGGNPAQFVRAFRVTDEALFYSIVKYAAYKLKCLDRLPQIGMAEA